MSVKFQNKYRIESTRLKNWDYRNNGAYFITICTKNRKHYFGKIIDKRMELNGIGLFANNFWSEIPNHFPFVELGNFQIMPNHMHGILIINNSVDALHCNVSNQNESDALHCNVSNQNESDALHCNVSNQNESDALQIITNIDTLQCNASTENKNQFYSGISPKSGSISTIIRSYKSIVSKNSRLINSDFEWQSGFHDHIIRNSESFEKIQNYIENNPNNWKEDTFYN